MPRVFTGAVCWVFFFVWDFDFIRVGVCIHLNTAVTDPRPATTRPFKKKRVFFRQAYGAHLIKPATPSSRSRRRLGRKKPHQSGSLGSSDKDRPPRTDASWSTTSSLSGTGVESSAERLDNAQMRQGASGVSETRYVRYDMTNVDGCFRRWGVSWWWWWWYYCSVGILL